MAPSTAPNSITKNHLWLLFSPLTSYDLQVLCIPPPKCISNLAPPLIPLTTYRLAPTLITSDLTHLAQTLLPAPPLPAHLNKILSLNQSSYSLIQLVLPSHTNTWASLRGLFPVFASVSTCEEAPSIRILCFVSINQCFTSLWRLVFHFLWIIRIFCNYENENSTTGLESGVLKGQ